VQDFVLVSGELVGADELDDLVRTIAAMKHADAEIEMQFKITSDSPNLLRAITTLFQVDETVSIVHLAKNNGHKKVKTIKVNDGVKREPTRGPHVRSIEVLATGERISRFTLNKRLSERMIGPGTTLRSPKYGVITVATSGDSLVVMDTDERVV